MHRNPTRITFSIYFLPFNGLYYHSCIEIRPLSLQWPIPAAAFTTTVTLTSCRTQLLPSSGHYYQYDIDFWPHLLQWPTTTVELATIVTQKSGHFHNSDPLNDHQICILEATKSVLLIRIRTDLSFHASESNEDIIFYLIHTFQWALLPSLHWNLATFITVTHEIIIKYVS